MRWPKPVKTKLSSACNRSSPPIASAARSRTPRAGSSACAEAADDRQAAAIRPAIHRKSALVIDPPRPRVPPLTRQVCCTVGTGSGAVKPGNRCCLKNSPTLERPQVPFAAEQGCGLDLDRGAHLRLAQFGQVDGGAHHENRTDGDQLEDVDSAIEQQLGLLSMRWRLPGLVRELYDRRAPYITR